MLKVLAVTVVGLPIVIVDLMAETLVKLCRWLVPLVAVMTLFVLLVTRPSAELVFGAVQHFSRGLLYWIIAETVWVATRHALDRLMAYRQAA